MDYFKRLTLENSCARHWGKVANLIVKSEAEGRTKNRMKTRNGFQRFGQFACHLTTSWRNRVRRQASWLDDKHPFGLIPRLSDLPAIPILPN